MKIFFSFVCFIQCMMAAAFAYGNTWLAAPVAQDYEDFTYQDIAKSGTLAGQATDADGDPLTFSLLVGTDDGDMVINPDGSYTYTPYPLRYGIEQMVYMVCDNQGNCTTAAFTMYVIFLNDPPVAVNDYVFMELNTTLNFNVGANDIEPDAEIMHFNMLLGPSVGSITFNSNGTLSYTPPANYTGSVQLLYQACDPCNVCRNATVYITVVNANDPPSASDWNGNVIQEDTPWNASLNALVTDPENDPLTFSLLIPPANGSCTINANGTFTYTPAPNFFGSDSFTYRVCDYVMQCDNGVVYVNITAVNDTPVANNDNASTNEDTILNGSVATNDSDSEPGVLTYTITNNVDYGSINWNSNGSYSYSPAPNYFGRDTLSYQVCDAQGLCANAFLYITIISQNDIPVAVPDNYNGIEDTQISGSVANDTDVEGGVLIYSYSGSSPAGSLLVNANGGFVFNPVPNWNGTAQFTYTVCDAQGGCSQGTLTVTLAPVNDIPVVNHNNSEFTFENVPLNGNVAANDSDPDGDVLTYTTMDTAENGIFTLNQNGTYTYVPNTNWNGTEQFLITVCDPSNACVQNELTIEVVSVNQGIIAQNGSGNLNEDGVLNSTLTGLAFDADNDPITFEVSSNVGYGTLVLQSNGSFTYTPQPNFYGTDQFTFHACDPTLACDDAIFTLYVASVNDAPVAVSDEFFISEDQQLNASVANDTDADAENLSYSIITPPLHGNVTMNVNGNFTYTPNQNYFGDDVFSYQVCDALVCDAMQVQIHIASVNDFPVALDDSYMVLSHALLNGNISLNDSDAETANLTYNIVDDAMFGLFALNSSGAFFYQSEEDFDGVEMITVEVCDADQACVITNLTIDVVAGQTPPNAMSDNFSANEDNVISGNVAANDSDLQGGPLVYSVITPPAGGTLNFSGNGVFTYTPSPNSFGVFTFTYQVCDNTALCSQATVTINIAPVNDAPVALNDSNYADENEAISGNVSFNDSDVDGDVLTYSVIVGAQHAIFTMNPNGVYYYTPNANFFGTEVITYQVCDGTTCTQASLFIEIGFINDPPVVVGENYSLSKNTVFNANLSTNDFDLDIEPLLYYAIVGPSHGTFSLSQTTGQFIYTPATNFVGTDMVIYMACDPCGACATATAIFNITDVNIPPVATDDIYTINEGTILNNNLSLNDINAGNNQLTYSLTSTPILGTFILNTNGSFSYTPSPGVFGTETLTYRVCDAQDCDDAQITIYILSTNSGPIAVDDAYYIFQNQQLVSDASVNDIDNDNDQLTYALLEGPFHGIILLDADGSFTYTPEQDYTGTDIITISACDAETCDISIIQITIFEIVDTPIAVDDEYTTNDDDPVSGSVALNDLDAQNDVLTFILIELPANGTIEFNDNGTFIYTPNPAFIGDDFIIYQVCDGSGCDTGMLTIHVIDGNEVPVTDDDYVYTLEDTPVAGDVSLNDWDEEDEELTYYLLETTWLGNIVFNIDGSFLLTPYPGLYGNDQLDYIACDDDGACDTNYVEIIVLFVNDLPTVMNEYAEVTEGEIIFGNVSSNDFDEDNDVINFSLSSTAIHGILQFNNDGTYIYEPFENYNGQEVIIYSACDGTGCSTGTLTIQITAINSMPVVIGESATIPEQFTLTGDLSLNDSDPDDDVLLYTVVVPPVNGVIDLELDGTYTYTGGNEFNGLETIVYQACDELNVCVQATLEITVTFVNDIPQILDETVIVDEGTSVSGSVALNDIELDNEILIYEVLANATNGVFEMFDDGSYTYIPNDGFVGVDYIYYQGCDPCGACDDGLLTIIVNDVILLNNPPVANSATFTVCQASGFALDLDELISDVEEADEVLNIEIDSPLSGSIVFNNFENILQYNSDVVNTEPVEINYTVCDNAEVPLCESATIYVNIIPFNIPAITEVMVTHVDCFGGEDGEIEILAISGSGNLTLNWADNNSDDLLRTNLTAGDYPLTITSDAECSIIGNYVLTVSGPSAPLTATADLLSGISIGVNGAVDLTITGGTPPYEVVWLGPNGFIAETEDISELTNTGQYTAYITDLKNCDASAQIEVISVIEIENEIEISVVPNPSHDQAIMTIQGLNGQLVSYRIYDATGKLIAESLNNNWNNQHTEVLNVATWAPGMYQLKLMAGESVAMFKLLKQ